jgi:hypothetical protein
MVWCDCYNERQYVIRIEPPGPPLIYKASMNINEGHLHKVTCTSTGGHPTASLQWYRENKKVCLVELNTSSLF